MATFESQQRPPVLARSTAPVPPGLRRRMEHAGGVDLADVRVHSGSPAPARHDADAYATGGEIFLGPRGGDLLAHELWHVVQQRQGRVAASLRAAGIAVNEDPALEREADAAAAGRPPATVPAAIASPAAGVAQFGRKKKNKGKGKDTGPKLVSVEDTSSQDIAADVFAGDDDLKTLMQEAALAALTTYAYHATRSRNAPSILSEGLDPDYGGTGAAKGDATFEQHSKNKVHYTRQISLADDYKSYFEGGTPFGTRQVDKPAPAEVLQVAVHANLLGSEAVDPDSARTDRAFTNTGAVPGEYIRSLAPVPVDPSETETELPVLSKKAMRAMLVQGSAESDALWSNMSKAGRDVVDDMVEASDHLTRADVLQMVRNGLHSFRLDDLVPYATLMRLGFQGRANDTAPGRMVVRYKDRWQ